MGIAAPRNYRGDRNDTSFTADRQIDALVYQLYGLTDEEIKILEGWFFVGARCIVP